MAETHDNIICVVGPTASGKTRMAVELAKALGGEVVSCDSMQIYRGMSVGTAKPTPDEMDGVQHHMIDVADPSEPFSAGKYVEMADACVQDILSRGKVVVIAGGTGLYVDSLIAGRSFAPVPSTGKREALEHRADKEGIQPLLSALAAIDPESAARLHPSDRRRIIRALEIYQETGETITEHDRKTRLQPPKYRPVWLGMTFCNRAELYARIDKRVELMMADGLLDEVRALLDAGVPATATAMQAIGYKELTGALRGEESVDEAVGLIQQRSRNYAKRQLTWFRRNPEIHWLEQTLPLDFSTVFETARRYIPFFAGE